MNIAITQREITIRGWTYDCTQQDWFDFLGQHTLWTIPNNAPFNLTEADCLFVSGGTGSERRDRTESMAIQLFADKPVVGVCHGAFFMNELFGGTNSTIEGHQGTEHTIEMESKVYQVNSYHTELIETLADCLEPIAWDMDGNVEGFRHKTRPLWGIVWHPERMKTPVLPKAVEELLND